MARDTKRQASAATPDQPPAKKLTAAQLPTKKPTAVQTAPGPISLSPPLPSRRQGNTQLIQDSFTEDEAPLIHTRCHADAPPKKESFEEDMGRREKQRDEDTIGSTFAEEDSEDEEDYCICSSLTRVKRHMPSQPVPVFITSPSTRDLRIERNTTPQKKPRKEKIPGTPSTKQAVAEARRPFLTDLVDKLADVSSATFLQGARDHVEYEDRALIYHYRLSIILKGFNQAELELLFSTSLPSFYGKLDKEGKRGLKGVFELAYHQVEQELINLIVTEAEVWLKTPAGDGYHDKYHLARSKRSQKVKLPPVPGLPQDLEFFMDKKGYKLDDVDIMRFVAGALAVCEITSHNTVQYKASDPKKDLGWSTWFKSDHVSGILYNAIQNVYSALIVGFASRMVTVNNRKLHTAAFRELLRLIPSFELPPSDKVQSHLPVFREPLPNPRELLASILHDLNAPPAPRASSPSYHTPAETEATDNTIGAALPAFERKASEVENEHLRYHAQMLAEDLDPLGETYLRKHELTSNAPVIRSRELARVISDHFSNLPPAGQVEMIYAILDEEETRLHTLIKSSYERIDTVSQQRKSLQAREEKLERVLQRLLKATKELEAEETMVDKAKGNIKRLDTSIDAAHDSLTSHPSVSFSALAAIAKHAAVAAAQAHTSQAKAAAQARASLSANAISRLHQEYNSVIKDKDVCSPADSLISDHSPTIGGAIPTPSSGPSPNPQVLDPAAQTSPPNQTESGDAGKPEEDALGDDNFSVFLPHSARN